MKNKQQKLIKNLGETIAAYRQKSGLTQEQVAEALGIGNEAVSRIERGIAIPTVLRLIELAEIFQCQVADLIVKNSNREVDRVDYLTNLLDQLSPQEQKLATKLIEQLVKHFGKESI